MGGWVDACIRACVRACACESFLGMMEDSIPITAPPSVVPSEREAADELLLSPGVGISLPVAELAETRESRDA